MNIERLASPEHLPIRTFTEVWHHHSHEITASFRVIIGENSGLVPMRVTPEHQVAFLEVIHGYLTDFLRDPTRTFTSRGLRWDRDVIGIPANSTGIHFLDADERVKDSQLSLLNQEVNAALATDNTQVYAFTLPRNKKSHAFLDNAPMDHVMRNLTAKELAARRLLRSYGVHFDHDDIFSFAKALGFSNGITTHHGPHSLHHNLYHRYNRLLKGKSR